MRNRNHPLGPQRKSTRMFKARWLLPAASGFLLACLLAGAYALGRNESTDAKPSGVTAAPLVQSQADHASNSGQTQDQKPTQTARQPDAAADFIITDRLLKSPLSWEDFQSEPVNTSVCIGGSIRIANSAARTVGLVDTPEESDATVSIGIVRAGNVITITPKEIGTFYISEADADGMLFRYEAKLCPKFTN